MPCLFYVVLLDGKLQLPITIQLVVAKKTRAPHLAGQWFLLIFADPRFSYVGLAHLPPMLLLRI